MLKTIYGRKDCMDYLPLHKGSAKLSIASKLLSVTNYDKKGLTTIERRVNDTTHPEFAYPFFKSRDFSCG